MPRGAERQSVPRGLARVLPAIGQVPSPRTDNQHARLVTCGLTRLSCSFLSWMRDMPHQSPTIQFLGGAGTVTGSKYLVEAAGRRILLDCGLFQGFKELRLRNWQAPAFDARSLDAVVLSHAHIDHCGYLSLLVKRGFAGPVYCTPATQSLLGIVLPDAAHIQEEDAAYANRKGFSKHRPAEPLFTVDDAASALRLVVPRSYHEPFAVTDAVQCILRRAGHILGSATVELQIAGPVPARLVFSGDLGRWGRPMLRDPEFVTQADVVLIESTYGNRVHGDNDANADLAKALLQAVERGGPVIVPAFAVGRTQELIWRIRELEDAGRIPRLPVFIDSPMATNVTDVFCRHPEDHSLDMKLLMDEERCPLCCKPYQFIRTPDESRSLNDRTGTFVIIAASGMATGGRVVHHLKQWLPNPRTTVLLVGFQAAGTRGRALQEGAKRIRMHGQDIFVRAHVAILHGLSAHAGRDELLRWVAAFKHPPKHAYVVHGEPPAADSLATAIRTDFGWEASIAQQGQKVPLA